MDYKDIPIIYDIYEDNHLLVVVKPMGVPVQADESGDPDMLTLLKRYLVDTYDKPGDAFLGLVHRLDRPTGGVMVFAKTSKAASRLSDAIREGEVEKRYLTVVEGCPRFKQDKLRCFLKKFPERNTVAVVPELTEGAKYAELDYKVLAEDKNRGQEEQHQPVVGQSRDGQGSSDKSADGGKRHARARRCQVRSRRKIQTPAMFVGDRTQVCPPRQRQSYGLQGLSARRTPVETVQH